MKHKFDPAIVSEIRDQLHKLSKHTPTKATWVLCIGDKGAGKSTLIANAEQSLNTTTQANLNYIRPTRVFDWWQCEQAVVIDPAGRYAMPKQVGSIQDHLWQKFLKLLKRRRGRNPIDSVLMVIDVNTLLSDEQHYEKLAYNLARQMQTIKAITKQVPVYLMISKCDHLSGFNAFFSHLTQEERTQPWGFSLESAETPKAALDQFIAHLSRQLIWRLHHEQNLAKRARIKDLPIQLTKLQTPLLYILSQLPFDASTPLKAIYFTSALQPSPTTELINSPIQTAFALPSNFSTAHRHQTYFIKQAMAQLLQPSKPQTHFSWHTQLPRLCSLSLATMLIAGAGWFWHANFQFNVATLNQVQTLLNKTTATTNAHSPLPWLTSTFALKNAYQVAAKPQFNQKLWLDLQPSESLSTLLHHSYQNQLQQYFKPYITTLLTHQIQDDTQKQQSIALYQSLKIYLMLTNRQHLKIQTVIDWFTQYWQAQYPQDKRLQAQLQALLKSYLSHFFTPIPKNSQLVALARDQLKNLSLIKLVLINLQQAYPNKNTNILDEKKSIDGIDFSKATVPILYSREQFKEVYEQTIPALAKTLVQNNWVMGNSIDPMYTPEQILSLINTIRQKYVAAFATHWQEAIGHIALQQPNSYTDIQQMLTRLENPKSSLWEHLYALMANATLNKEDNAENALKQFTQKAEFEALKTSLQQLSTYLHQITSADNPLQAAFNKSSHRFRHQDRDDAITKLLAQANTLPTPINHWTTTLASASWKIILNDTRLYINDAWQKNIIPTYDNTIKNRYPIFKNATKEIPIADFNHFFGPAGIMGKFFQTYLEPFVDISKNYWTWRQLDGLELDIPQTSLDMLLRASLIQIMFYTDDAKNPKMRFSLTPISFSKGVRSFVLNLDGQNTIITRNTTNSSSFTWPGPDTGFTTIRFNNKNGHKPTLTTTGPWAWFHLLDQTDIETTASPNHFYLNFKQNDDIGRFELTTDNRANPYLPNILTEFRLPESLMQPHG